MGYSLKFPSRDSKSNLKLVKVQEEVPNEKFYKVQVMSWEMLRRIMINTANEKETS